MTFVFTTAGFNLCMLPLSQHMKLLGNSLKKKKKKEEEEEEEEDKKRGKQEGQYWKLLVYFRLQLCFTFVILPLLFTFKLS